jgi:2-polyprenyl-3-methyl-5-hydroxy-6-metoxy-1,4-benzoquinol methylase
VTTITNRNECVFCGCTKLNEIVTLDKFPVFMGTVTESEANKYIYEDLRYVECDECNNLQIESLVPLEILYASNHNVEVVGSLWSNHYNKFGDFIIDNKNGKNVLEIGCPSAKLAKQCIAKSEDLMWEIIEPNPQDTDKMPPQIKYEKKWLNDLTSDKKYDNIVLSHVFEHLFNPLPDLKKIYNLLDKKGKMFLSIPNMKFLLDKERLPPAGLNFEHTYYIDDHTVHFFLEKAGFKIVSKMKYENHSLFYCCEKTNININISIAELDTLRLYNHQISQKFQRVVDKYCLLVKNINKQIDKINLPVYIFGAYFNSQMFLSLGLSCKNVHGILDNSKDKIGKVLYGTRLKIYSPVVLKNKKSIVICHVGIYTEEIKHDIINNINPEVIFL